MADDSPGKVQALRAMFSEKKQPLMGMPPGGKMPGKHWRCSTDSIGDTPTFKERIISEKKSTSMLITKVLPVPSKSIDVASMNGVTNGMSKVPHKPSIGPKPHLSLQTRTESPTNNSETDTCDTSRCESWTFSDTNLLNSQAKSRAVAETIATFMFAKGLKETNNLHKPQPKPRTKQQAQTELVNSCNEVQTQAQLDPSLRSSELMNSCNKSGRQFKLDPGLLCSEIMNSCNKSERHSKLDLLCSDLINSDNYICKSRCSFRKRLLPSLAELGPPPAKPPRPPNVVLPAKYRPVTSDVSSSITQSFHPSQTIVPVQPQKSLPQRPSYPCPPRPHTPPPLPPTSSVATNPIQTLRQELEELYEDTIFQSEGKRPVSLIPEFTEEEEEAEELYNDADFDNDGPLLSLVPLPPKPREYPPPYPPSSDYLQPRLNISGEDLYQDAEDANDEEFYEIMPCEDGFDEPDSPVYSNNKKEIEKLRREDEKKTRKEQKEKEKHEREMDKLKRKFGLTGEEVPIDDGLVKTDSKGGKGDLPVKKGETVLILRMEGNPAGRWLVKNERGKIGYVELTNIEVDPLSVKSVMTIRRLSVISASEDLYCEAKSEEEAIYEETY